jgi:8-oxo-dGTP diphosphatase
MERKRRTERPGPRGPRPGRPLPWPAVQVPRKVSEIDWPRWQAREQATLVFVVRGGEMLLMRKKRGLGAGKINGPGGRIEPGESRLECAVREVREELLITPLGLEEVGENAFQFVDGYSIRVFVFRANDLRGEPAETEEGAPLWSPLAEIPYHEMWEDDRLWLPLVLSGQRFLGRFVFEGDAMLDHQLELIPTAPARGGPRPPS